ncbi:hypothetical protein [Sphingomonas sp.]|uniref:hypothetical protein n=1 Tax=Sphingomonas sp. TaxID=28214 RepID=UPI002EDA5BD8
MIDVVDLRTACPAVWIEHLAANMRKQDLDEIAASSDLAPLDALTASLGASSHAYAVIGRGGDPVAMFGAAPHPLPGVGVVWMLGTDGITREAYGIARRTRRYFDELNASYWMLWNFIDDRNTVSMRWLRWGGFRLLASHPEHGPQRRPFHTFARINHV